MLTAGREEGHFLLKINFVGFNDNRGIVSRCEGQIPPSLRLLVLLSPAVIL